MKKLVLFACLLCAALSLAACGPDSVSCYGTGGAEAGAAGTGAETGEADPDAPVSASGTAPVEIDGIRTGEPDPHVEKGVQFYGTVSERGAGYLLVAPDEGRVRLTAGPDGKFDEVELFRVEVGEEFDISEYRTGDRVAVTYSGERTETEPPEIRAMDIFPLDEAIAEGPDGDPAGYAPARCVYVKGKLYYDTGRVPEQGPTCGTMDGYLTEIPENETPDADGEANFPLSAEQGWQLWSGNAVVAQVDGAWHVFETDGTPTDSGRASPTRCIYVKGKLYYDTGRVPEQGPTCGTMDGYLTEIPEDETPDADGEANFPLSEEQGWQLWSANAVVTQVDGEWHIFESGEFFPLCSLPTAEPKTRAGED